MKLAIGPDHENPPEDPDTETDGEKDENESVYFVQLGEEIPQAGHTQKRRLNRVGRG